MELFHARRDVRTRWVDFENPEGKAGEAGQENLGAKGHAFDIIGAGQTLTLLNLSQSGVLRRIWMTLNHREPKVLRALVLRMYWEGGEKPAVECPLADFFGFGLASMSPFCSELFSSPEGRSLNCFIPMPFAQSARVTLENENPHPVKLFYDIDCTLEAVDPRKALYFHAYWSRKRPQAPGQDHPLLPRIAGHGRFLGASFGVLTAPVYRNTWFGEGEVKIYLDGDSNFPTLAGTGIEDYIGTAWGQGTFDHPTQGCLESDMAAGRFAFYRWHTVDPIYFQDGCRVDVQQIGGASCETALLLREEGAPLQIVSADSDAQGFLPLYKKGGFPLTRENAISDAWYNFYRQDDYATCAYFYLDRPQSELPPLAGLAERVAALPSPPQK